MPEGPDDPKDPMPGMNRCAVLGSPIAHSLSPVLHRAAYAALGLLDWHYDRFEVDDTELAGFVAALDDADGRWRGLSMTKPLKAAALALGEGDEQVALSGAANTMIFSPPTSTRHGGRPRLHNTDIDGLTNALRAAGIDRIDRAAILGAGGTTRAALVSLTALGAQEAQIFARRPEQIEELRPLAHRLGLGLTAHRWAEDLRPADLLISTVTAAAAGTRVDQLDRIGAVFDAVYDPWPTPLARAALARQCTVINGLELLAHQAVGQVELMTGLSVPVEVLLAAGRKAMSGRSGA